MVFMGKKSPMNHSHVFMDELAGWKKYSQSGMTLWFKGYLHREYSIEKLVDDAALYSEKPEISIEILAGWVNGLCGHFSFIVSGVYWSFATVDKVSSIPLFYSTSNRKTTLGNHAPKIKQENGLGRSDLDMGAALEIAMSGYTIGRKTLYKGIYQLTAGECILVCSPENVERAFYYTYTPWNIENKSKRQLQNELSETLVETLNTMVKSVNGRQIVIPLSAGYDSRLVVSGLKHLGVKDVFCFTYGRSGNFESQASKVVAKRLGYEWYEVALTPKIQRNYFLSDEFNAFKKFSDTLSSAPHIQEVNAIGLLKRSGLISSDAVIVNGNTGDFISGGHIPPLLRGEEIKGYDKSMLLKQCWNSILDKHFTLWKSLRQDSSDQHMVSELNYLLNERSIPGLKNLGLEQVHGVFECMEYLGRQSKYIVSMQRAYEFHGYEWRMPLWDDSMLGFFENIPRTQKSNQSLYVKTLHDNNWGGVWEDVPVNHKLIQSGWIRFSRLAAKAALFPFERKVWNRFEKNVFEYFMDPTGNTGYTNYLDVLFDRKGQRHTMSWVSRKYLMWHGVDMF
jgi:asparagine synthase (glutamine-hydrolysing)